MNSWGRIGAWLTMCLGVCGTGMSNAHADEVLDDLVGRIEYAFYAADSRSLQQSWQQLEKLQVEPADSPLRDSYLNYGRWKIAQLLAKDNPAQAQQFAQACADSKAIAKDAPTLAVHHALVAACYAMLETLRPMRRVLYRNDREAALALAMQSSSNAAPQVLFIAASLDLQHEAADKAYKFLTQATSGFAANQATQRSTAADWGYPEACYLLGKLELARGNVLAARNALEQALVQAPDYRDAQQLLKSLNLK